MGFKTKDVAGYVIKELELPLTADEFKQEIFGIYQELFPHANPMPGIKTRRFGIGFII